MTLIKSKKLESCLTLTSFQKKHSSSKSIEIEHYIANFLNPNILRYQEIDNPRQIHISSYSSQFKLKQKW